MNRTRNGSLLLLALAMLATCGCIRSLAEDGVRKSLSRLIGPAERYEVHIERTSDGDLLAGRIEDLCITGHKVRTKDGLVIERLAVVLHKLKVDTRRKRVERVESATFDIDVTQEALSRLAAHRTHGLGNPQVQLQGGTVTVVLPARLLSAAVDTVLQGRLEVEDGRRVAFKADDLRIGPLPVPPALVSAALDRINPLADLRTLPVPAVIDSLTADKGLLNAKGRLFVPPNAEEPPAPLPPPGSASPSPPPMMAPEPR